MLRHRDYNWCCFPWSRRNKFLYNVYARLPSSNLAQKFTFHARLQPVPSSPLNSKVRLAALASSGVFTGKSGLQDAMHISVIHACDEDSTSSKSLYHSCNCPLLPIAKGIYIFACSNDCIPETKHQYLILLDALSVFSNKSRIMPISIVVETERPGSFCHHNSNHSPVKWKAQ